MKKFYKFTAFLLLLILCFTISISSAPDKVRVQLNGVEIKFEVDPQIINNRTMVPLRAISDAIGATLLWSGENSSILLNLGDTVAMLQINNPNLFKNDEVITLDSPPIIIKNRTLVPVRAICETFGVDVEWNADECLVILTTK